MKSIISLILSILYIDKTPYIDALLAKCPWEFFASERNKEKQYEESDKHDDMRLNFLDFYGSLCRVCVIFFAPFCFPNKTMR